MEGGQYRPLADADIVRIHQASLEILERYGIGDTSESWRRIAAENGATISDAGRICFPPTLVEEAIAGAARSITLRGQDPRHDIVLGGTRVNVGASSYAANILDHSTGRHRDPTVGDLYDAVRLEDTLDNLHYVRIPLIARDLPDARSLDLNSAYVLASATTKTFAMNLNQKAHVEDIVELFDMISGGAGRFREQPFCIGIQVPVIPPLRSAADVCDAWEACVRLGVPVLAATAGMAGATSPAPLAGSIAQGNAESLAALVIANMIEPGAPVALSSVPLVCDLRTGSCVFGGGEQALMEAVSVQLAHHYDLPCGVLAGATDGKAPGLQSGWEKGYNSALTFLAGGNHVGLAAGGHASNLGFSLESLVIDSDMLGGVLRAIRGMEVDDDTLSVDAIGEVIDGEGHFLDHPQTVARMEGYFHYPRFADRSTIQEWEQGGEDIMDRAHRHVCEVLASHYPDHIPVEVDQAIRERFDIHLPREWMEPINERWP